MDLLRCPSEKENPIADWVVQDQSHPVILSSSLTNGLLRLGKAKTTRSEILHTDTQGRVKP